MCDIHNFVEYKYKRGFTCISNYNYKLIHKLGKKKYDKLTKIRLIISELYFILFKLIHYNDKNKSHICITDRWFPMLMT